MDIAIVYIYLIHLKTLIFPHRYLYKEEVVIQSVPTALSTFYAAQKYLCPGLMKLCITYLDQKLDVSNALQVNFGETNNKIFTNSNCSWSYFIDI